MSEMRNVYKKKELDDIAREVVNTWMEENKLIFSYKFSGEVNHIFTHFHLKLILVKLELKNIVKMPKFMWFSWEEIEKKPVSKLMQKIKDELK